MGNVQKIVDLFTIAGKQLALELKAIKFRNTKNPVSRGDMLCTPKTTKNRRDIMILIPKRKRRHSRSITQRVQNHKQQSRQQPMFQPIVRLLTTSILLFRHNILHKALKHPSISISIQQLSPVHPTHPNSSSSSCKNLLTHHPPVASCL